MNDLINDMIKTCKEYACNPNRIYIKIIFEADEEMPSDEYEVWVDVLFNIDGELVTKGKILNASFSDKALLDDLAFCSSKIKDCYENEGKDVPSSLEIEADENGFRTNEIFGTLLKGKTEEDLYYEWVDRLN